MSIPLLVGRDQVHRVLYLDRPLLNGEIQFEPLAAVYDLGYYVSFFIPQFFLFGRCGPPYFMPPDHQAYLQWNGERFLRWAEQIGQHTAAVVRLFLSAHKVEQQGYKSCMALLKLAERYSSQRLESACRKALSYTASPSLKSVQSILKSGQDTLSPVEYQTHKETPKAHKFTRGAGYYKRGE